MITVQELIKQHIHSNGYTIYAISQQSGINRTTLQKILSGQRSLTKEIYDKLISFFPLTEIDREELDTAFLIDQIGTERFETHMEIKDILEMSTNLLYQSTNAPVPTFYPIEQLENGMFLQNSYDIANTLYSITLQTVKQEAHPFLYTYADFAHPYTTLLFKPLYTSDFKALHISHLVEYKKNAAENSPYNNIHNIRMLKNLLPFFSAFPGSFSVYYYYATKNNFKQEALAFPYYILTNTHVILLSDSYEKALIFTDPAIHAHYLYTFNHATAKSNTLATDLVSPLSILHTLNETPASVHYPLCLNVQPTLEQFMTADMIDTYMLENPYKEVLRETLLKRIAQIQTGNHTILFTLEGLRLFTRQGKNINFPEHLASHFNTTDRIYILNQLIASNHSENGNHFLLLNPLKLHTSLHISLAFVPPLHTILQLIRADGSQMMIPLKEFTLCNSIMDFVQTLPQYGYVYSLEETNQILMDEQLYLQKTLSD